MKYHHPESARQTEVTAHLPHADPIAIPHPMPTTWEKLRGALGVMIFTVSGLTPVQCEEFLEDAAKAGPLKIVRDHLLADAGAEAPMDAVSTSRYNAAVAMLDLLAQQADTARRTGLVSRIKSLVATMVTPARTVFDDRAVWALVNAAEQTAHLLESRPSVSLEATTAAMNIRNSVLAVRLSAAGAGQTPHAGPQGTATVSMHGASGGAPDASGKWMSSDAADAMGRG